MSRVRSDGAERRNASSAPAARPSPRPSATATSPRETMSGPTVGSCDFHRYDESVTPLTSAIITPAKRRPYNASTRRRAKPQIVMPAATHTITETKLSPKY